MKRLLLTLALSLSLWVPALAVVSSTPVGAIDIFHSICTGQNGTSTNAGPSAVCKQNDSGNPVTKAIQVATDILAIIIGVSATIVIILSAFKMVRANGNAQEIGQARNGILYAVIGLAIAILAPIIVGYVINSLK